MHRLVHRAIGSSGRILDQLQSSRGIFKQSRSPPSPAIAQPSQWHYERHLDRNETPVQPTFDGRFVVVELGSQQFKVSVDDVIVAEKLNDVAVNDIVRLHSVLLAASESCTIVGRPTVEGASVLCLVEEQLREQKKLIFKKKRRKHQENRAGHRQQLTALRVLSFDGLDSLVPPAAAANNSNTTSAVKVASATSVTAAEHDGADVRSRAD